MSIPLTKEAIDSHTPGWWGYFGLDPALNDVVLFELKDNLYALALIDNTTREVTEYSISLENNGEIPIWRGGEIPSDLLKEAPILVADFDLDDVEIAKLYIEEFEGKT